MYQTILDDLKKAMLAKDAERLLALRAIKAALLEKEIAERKGGDATLAEEQIIGVLQKMVKQRKDSLAQFSAAGRMDLAEKEQKEMSVIEAYLPQMMTEDEISKYVSAKMIELNVSKAAEIGKLMGVLMKDLRGKADGTLINAVVKSKLQP